MRLCCLLLVCPRKEDQMKRRAEALLGITLDEDRPLGCRLRGAEVRWDVGCVGRRGLGGWEC